MEVFPYLYFIAGSHRCNRITARSIALDTLRAMSETIVLIASSRCSRALSRSHINH